MTCDCPDWKPNIEKVNAPIINQSLRWSGYKYDGKVFVYCPWCGAVLEDDTPLELTDEPVDRATVEFIEKCMTGS